MTLRPEISVVKLDQSLPRYELPSEHGNAQAAGLVVMCFCALVCATVFLLKSCSLIN